MISVTKRNDVGLDIIQVVSGGDTSESAYTGDGRSSIGSIDGLMCPV